MVNTGMWLSCSSSSIFSSSLVAIKSPVVVLLILSFNVPTWVLIFVKCLQVCQQCLSSMPSTSPTSFSHVRDKMFFSCLGIRDQFDSFKLSKDVLYLLMSFWSFVVFWFSFLIFLLMSFTWAFSVSVHILSFLDEGKELSVFGVNRCFSVHSRFSRVLLLCFTSQFRSLRFRRRHVLLLLGFTNHFFGLRCRRRRVLPLRYFCLLGCCCFMLASDPLFKFLISSLDFMDSPVGSGSSRVSIDAGCLLHLVCLKRLLFRSSLFSPPFFLPHRKCAVTDLWSLSKWSMSFALAQVQYLLLLL